jgi:hypothetical protein
MLSASRARVSNNEFSICLRPPLPVRRTPVRTLGQTGQAGRLYNEGTARRAGFSDQYRETKENRSIQAAFRPKTWLAGSLRGSATNVKGPFHG